MTTHTVCAHRMTIRFAGLWLWKLVMCVCVVMCVCGDAFFRSRLPCVGK